MLKVSRQEIFKKRRDAVMSPRKWFSWPLPFGDKCDPRCEDDLHNAWCFIFGVVFVVVTLVATAVLRQCTHLSVICLLLLWLFFGVTWGLQRNFVIRFWCRRCLQAGDPVCPRCGGRVEFNNDYVFYSLLLVSVCSGTMKRCGECGYSEEIVSRHCW